MVKNIATRSIRWWISARCIRLKVHNGPFSIIIMDLIVFICLSLYSDITRDHPVYVMAY